MKIIQLASQIKKWEQSNDNYVGKLIDGEKPGFSLKEHHPINKSLLKISLNIYITNVDTDFILDVDLDSFIQFDPHGSIPTIQELYDIYKICHDNSRDIILKESISRGILIDRKTTPIQFEKLEGLLKKAISQTYPDSYYM